VTLVVSKAERLPPRSFRADQLAQVHQPDHSLDRSHKHHELLLMILSELESPDSRLHRGDRFPVSARNARRHSQQIPCKRVRLLVSGLRAECHARIRAASVSDDAGPAPGEMLSPFGEGKSVAPFESQSRGNSLFSIEVARRRSALCDFGIHLVAGDSGKEAPENAFSSPETELRFPEEAIAY